MDPTIAAACIGGGAAILSGGWTALVAITTTRSARRTNQATIDAAAENTKRALDAAREERLWDRRAEAYADAPLCRPAPAGTTQRHDQDLQVRPGD